MTKTFFRVVTFMALVITILGTGALLWLPWEHSRSVRRLQRETLVVIPQSVIDGEVLPLDKSGITARVALDDGEILVAVLTDIFDDDEFESQIIAYRNINESNGAIHITYVAYDHTSQQYVRFWNAPVLAGRPGSVRIFRQDLIGDHNRVLIVSGLNHAGEHTLTVFRQDLSEARTVPFATIAALQADISILIQERERSQAYYHGTTRGYSFPIVVRSSDTNSSNRLDQKEVIYTFNEAWGFFEELSVSHIPASQVERLRFQELLGSQRDLESFISGLWVYTNTQGISRYIYFDPRSKDLIFFEDSVQQVFSWLDSTMTALGMSVSAQNVSADNIQRSVNIELESLNSLRVRVSEDARLRVAISPVWDGSYRRVASRPSENMSSPASFSFEGQFNGSSGTFNFFENGFYTLHSEENNRTLRGRFAFFTLSDHNLVEFRPESGRNGKNGGNKAQERELYLVESSVNDVFTLFPVRLGTRGIEKLNKPAVHLSANSAEDFSVVIEEESPVVVEEEAIPLPVLTLFSTPEYFSPDGDGVNDTLNFSLNVQSVYPITSWNLEIREPRPPFQVFHSFGGNGRPTERIVWNGRNGRGELVQSASDYRVIFRVQDNQGRTSSIESFIRVDVLIIREEGGIMRMQIPSIVFQGGAVDFTGLATEDMENNDRVLRRIAEILNRFREYSVLVEGHANRTEADAAAAALEEANELQPLSEARACTVVNYLATLGVNRSRLSYVGKGSSRPVARFEDFYEWWKNRRVEFILVR